MPRRPPASPKKSAAALARENARRDVFHEAIGADLRKHREAAELRQEDLADIVGWNKDAISKAERGQFPIKLYDYLVLMRFLRDTDPTHPAVALAERVLGRGKVSGE